MRYASITVKSVLAGFFLLLASASAHAEVGSFTDYIENGVFFKEHPCFLYVEVREGAEIDDLKLNINPLKCYESYKSEMSKTSTDPALKTGTDSAPAVAVRVSRAVSELPDFSILWEQMENQYNDFGCHPAGAPYVNHERETTNLCN